jgi:hypothetical protein
MALGLRTRVQQVIPVGGEIVVVWGDGHESYYAGAALRKACTCAACKGERHLFGRATLPTLTSLKPDASRRAWSATMACRSPGPTATTMESTHLTTCAPPARATSADRSETWGSPREPSHGLKGGLIARG